MEVAAVTVSVGALGVSLGALRYTRRADERAKEHEKRLQAQEERSQAQDERDKRRMQREEADSLARQQAYPRAEYVGAATLPGRAYRFRITNTGRDAASDLDAWLIDEKGRPASEFSQENTRIGVLQRDQSGEVEVAVTDEALGRNPLFLRLTWLDRSGANERVSRVDVPSA